MNKSSVSNKFKNLYWLIAIITIGMVIFFAVGIAIFYVTANDIYQSINNTNQSINNIYSIMTIAASTQEQKLEVSTSTSTAQVTINSSESLLTPSPTTAPTQTQKAQPVLSLSATQPPPFASCDCKKIFSCSDFSSPNEAQNCFLACGGSSTNNWSNLDNDQDGYACNISTTYP